MVTPRPYDLSPLKHIRRCPDFCPLMGVAHTFPQSLVVSVFQLGDLACRLELSDLSWEWEKQLTGVYIANVAEPRARAGMTLARLTADRPEGRESVSDRGDAHPVRSLGLFRSLSSLLSHMLLVLRRQLAPSLLCRPGDT